MEKQDSTRLFLKELKKLIEDYEDKTGVAITDIDISWLGEMNGNHIFDEVKLRSHSRGV